MSNSGEQKISTTLNVDLLICADEDLTKVLKGFLDGIQQESRLDINELKLTLEINKNYYVDRSNIKY